MEICGMTLAQSLDLLVNNKFSESEKCHRLRIKREISQKISGRSNGDATVVAYEVIKVLSSLRQDMRIYPEVGLADLLSLINSKSEGLKRNFPSEVQKKIRDVICWQEWRSFPPTSPVHIFRQ
ncbi:MAG: hypothetical protein V3574_03930 [Candidatus Moraniibacteriota bacterium]